MFVEPLVITHDPHAVIVEAPAVPASETPVLGPPTEEQARLADQVFGTQESNLALGLLGMQAGILILHDLALEHFSPDEEEKKPEAPARLLDPSPEA